MVDNISSTMRRIEDIIRKVSPPETSHNKPGGSSPRASSQNQMRLDAYRTSMRGGGANSRLSVGGTDEREFSEIIDHYSSKYGVEPSLVKAVIKAESNFNPEAVSSAGAKGLMQLMDGTARSLGVNDSFDPAQNIGGGVKYLRDMMNRFKSVPLALAAYNAGPGAVEKYGGIPPYAETQEYVKRVGEYQSLFERRV